MKMPNATRNSIASGSVLFGLSGICLFAIYLIFRAQSPDPLPPKILNIQTFTGVMAWLFAVALFVERAVEVVVMVFRDQSADLLDDAEAQAKADWEAKAKVSADAMTTIVATQAQKSAAVQAAKEARQKFDDAHKENVVYRAGTKEFALQVGFAFGLLVSLAGVRTLHELVDWEALKQCVGVLPPLSRVFTLADIVVTGAMLAGGSEGIHRIANVFTSFMDTTSDRIDQKKLPQK